MTACPRAQARFVLAAFLLTLSALGLAGAPTPANANANADASPRAERGSSSQQRGAKTSKRTTRAARRACVKRLSKRRGVSRREARQLCKRRASRRPTSGSSPATTAPAPAVGAPTAAPQAAPAAAAGCPGADTTPTAAGIVTARAAVLCLVNAQRAAQGLGALADNAQLTAAAQGHSDDMVGRRYFSHASADGRTFSARIAAAGYGGAAMGENIAWGSGAQGTPAQIVTGWMNSPGHRANILNGAFSSSGVGVAAGTPTGASGATYTHDFGG